jgi:hypothetical protein
MTLRQLAAYGRDGLPVLSGDGRLVEGWITNASVLDAVAGQIGSSPLQQAPAGPADDGGSGRSGSGSAGQPPTPLHGYQVMEVTVMAGSPAAGQAIGHVAWPAGTIPVSLLRHRRLEEPDPVIVLAPGDRLSLLAPVGPAAPLSS